MNPLSKRIALATATLGLVAVTAIPVFAATPSTSTGTAPVDPRASLIQSLVQRFHLNQSDVEQFFNDQEQQHANEALTRLEQRLSQDVTSGKLTDAQKAAIVAKAKEAQAKHEAARKLSPEECKKMMDQYRTELETWASQQGIDRSYLRDIMGGPGGHGGPMGGLRGGSDRGGRGRRGQAQFAPGMNGGPQGPHGGRGQNALQQP